MAKPTAEHPHQKHNAGLESGYSKLVDSLLLVVLCLITDLALAHQQPTAPLIFYTLNDTAFYVGPAGFEISGTPQSIATHRNSSTLHRHTTASGPGRLDGNSAETKEYLWHTERRQRANFQVSAAAGSDCVVHNLTLHKMECTYAQCASHLVQMSKFGCRCAKVFCNTSGVAVMTHLVL